MFQLQGERIMNPTGVVLDWKYAYFDKSGDLFRHIESCKKRDHDYQVTYSSYNKTFTHVCFHCKKVRVANE